LYFSVDTSASRIKLFQGLEGSLSQTYLSLEVSHSAFRGGGVPFPVADAIAQTVILVLIVDQILTLNHDLTVDHAHTVAVAHTEAVVLTVAVAHTEAVLS